MKRIICLALAVMFCFVNVTVLAQDTDMTVSALLNVETVEVGDQFAVKIKLTDVKPYLTFRLSGSFNCDVAQLVAPIYSNKDLGIVENVIDNTEGKFTFVAYDQRINGISDEVVCSLLFEAKAEGEFELTFNENTMFGKADENAFYSLEYVPLTVTVGADTDEKNVVIIKDAEPITPFDDMFGYDWAEKEVGVMYDLGVLEDIADTSYYPGEKITRGDFITMLVRVCKLRNKANVEPFRDVNEDSYQYSAVMTAKALGIAKGDGDGNFRPDDFITRQDICTLVFRTMLKMNKVDPKIEPDTYLAKFSDKGEIAPYAVEGVAGLIRAKILVGDDKGLLRPADNMTRAEAAVLLNRLAEFNILVSR